VELEGIEVARLDVLELHDLLLHAGYDDTAALLLIADAAGDGSGRARQRIAASSAATLAIRAMRRGWRSCGRRKL